MTIIFVSHATLDDAVVTHLHDELQAATGYELWVDHRNLKPPESNWPVAIHEALKACNAGLLAISRHSVQRPEVVAEWRYLINVQRPLYVAKLDDVPVEDVDYRLHIIQWIDLSYDLEAGITALAAFMQGARSPENAPIVLSRPITGNVDPRLTAIPISGRDKDIDRVMLLLRKGPTSVLGVGGLGKSRLAAEIVLRSTDVQGAIWHTASDVSHTDDVFELLRNHFGLPVTTSRRETLAPLRTRKRLIVLDNVESIRDVERPTYVQLIDELYAVGALVLLTGRVQWDEIKMGQLYHPQQLPPDVAEKVVQDMQEAFESPHDLSSCANEMARAARQHPRLIEWAVRQTRKFAPDKVIGDLQSLKSTRVQEALDEMIYKTLRQMVDAEGPEPEHALHRLAVCRGGFTYAAAKAILSTYNDALDAWLETLQTWQFVNLRVVDKQTRYDVDPMVLVAVAQDRTAHRAHYDYYYALTKQHNENQDYSALDVESDNLDVAFEWALDSGQTKMAYWLANRCADFLLNRGRFKQFVRWLECVAAVMTDHTDDILRAGVQNDLSIAYRNLASVEDRVHNLRRAIAACTEVLRYLSPQSASLYYATAQNNLGAAYGALASIEDRVNNLRRAVAAYTEALRNFSPQSALLYYGGIQNNLGVAYGALASVEDQADNLHHAIAAFNEALHYRTSQNVPLSYAETQNNLGTAYRALASVEDQVDNLRRAITAFTEALHYFTPRSAPLNYAMTQRNIGIAYTELGDLPAAIACWREAERYYRRMGAVEDADLMLRWLTDTEARQ